MSKEYNDISVHFTLNGQTIEQIKEKIKNYIMNNQDSPLAEFFLDGENSSDKVVHHCFLPDRIIEEKEYSKEIINFIKGTSENVVCWRDSSQIALSEDKYNMLRNLKRVNGLAVFIGNIKGRVNQELEYAHHFNCDILIIP